MSSVRLFTSLYPERNPLRQQELIHCLSENLRSPVFNSICLFLENLDLPPLSHEKLISRPIGHRPRYEDFLQWARECQPKPDDLTVIANSDIYFDESVQALQYALAAEQCAALSRWDIQEAGKPELFYRNDSQDVWVFKGAMRDVKAEFPVGIPRCDNRLLHELNQVGFEVINPSFSIRSYHLHAGKREEYQSKHLEHFVDPPYAYLWPHNLWSLLRTLIYNLNHPEARVGWRLDRRKIAASLPVRAVRKVFGAIRPKRASEAETE